MFDHYTDIFQRRGAQYTAAMLQWPRARQAEFTLALSTAQVATGQHLLDIPAGGAYLRDWLPVVPEGSSVRATIAYTAVESTDGFLERLPPAERPPLVLAPTLTDIPLAYGAADRLISLAGLHHIEHRGPVYAEMRRLVSSGGVACVADVQIDTTTARFLNGPVDRFCQLGHRGVFLDDTDVPQIQAAGWQPLEDHIVDVAWRFASLADMAGFCRLLFGLDNAPGDDAVIDAINDGPGVTHQGDEVLMHWPLRFIRLLAV